VLLRPLDDAVLDQLLVRYRPDIPESDRAVLRMLAEGSIGCALQLATAHGLDAWRKLAAMFAALADGDDRLLLAFAADPSTSAEPEGFRTTAHLLSWWLRALARSAGGAGTDAGAIPGDGARTLRRLAVAGTLDRWLKVWENTHRLAGHAAAGNLDRKQILTTILLNLRSEVRPVSL
jgi:DNA polymerase III subunit delta'